MTFRTIDTDIAVLGATETANATPHAVTASRRNRSRHCRSSRTGGVRFIGLGI